MLSLADARLRHGGPVFVLRRMLEVNWALLVDLVVVVLDWGHWSATTLVVMVVVADLVATQG